MRSLLIGINAKYIHPNLAIRLLKANTNYECDWVEFNIKDNPDEIINYILTKQYDLVAFSCYIWNIEIVKIILEKLKNTELIKVLGGPEVSYNAADYLNSSLATYVIKNEGEEAFNLLLGYLHGDNELTQVPNLYYKNNYTFDKYVDINNAKMAYDLFDDVENKIVYIETSRGCPYHCGYCMASLDNKVRFFNIEEIKRNVLALINKKARVFKFLDRTFNANKKNFIDLIDFIILNHKPNNSFQFEITGDLLDEEIIHYINSKAPKNLFRFEIGIQSTNVKANLAVGRIQNNQKLFKNIKLIQDANIIDLHLDLIAGLPYENYESFEKTFNDVLALEPKELQLGFLKLLHGTKLYEQQHTYGYKYMTTSPYEIIENNFMSKEDICNIHICEEAFEKYYNSDYYKKTLKLIIPKIENKYLFFYRLGQKLINTKPKTLEDSFAVFNEYLEKQANFPELHFSLVLEYLELYRVKPKAWWNERLTSSDKKALIRKLLSNKEIQYDPVTLYKYSLICVLGKKTIVAVYKNNECKIVIL